MLPSPRTARLRAIVAVVLLATASVFVSAAHAASITLGVALDTDANPATGCTIATANGPATGIERLVTVSVVTSGAGATVDHVDIAQCSGGSMGPPQSLDGGGWPVGIGNGTGGTSVVELAIPLSVLPAGATMRAFVVADNGAGGADATGAFTIALRRDGPAAPPAIPVPLAPWLVLPLGLLVFVALRWLGPRLPRQMTIVAVCAILALSGIAWAASVMRDGDVGDWAGTAAAIIDPTGDAPANADLAAAFYQQDATNLYLRIDADIRRDQGGNGNVAPTVHAGGDQTVTLPASATLAASVSDDGVPNPPGAVTIAWTKVSGPGTVTFASPASAATTASFSAAGSYVLQLAAYDGALASTDQVTITVDAGGGANAVPVVNAGADQTVTLPAGATLAGGASDDGLPNPPGALALHWSLVSGPGSAVSFADDSVASTTATFGGPGTYVLRLSASDGALGASSDVTITVQSGAPAIEAVADRTIAPGDHLQIPLVAADHGVPGALTYGLPTAPVGATLAPPPVIDWTPTAAQLGTHAFMATVTNAAAQSASVTFHVMVAAPANRAPRLAPQANQSINAGMPFARTLTAVDPDGDTLAFSLTTKPVGMTLSGADIAWATASALPGDYTVTARVTDSGGQFDQATFTISVRASAAPSATDDEYTVNTGSTLSVPAPGVLGNDSSAIGAALSATKLTDPDKGTLGAFNADGSFIYTAPDTLPPATSLQTTQRWVSALYDNTGYSFAADINHDGGSDVIVESYGTPTAFDGKTGTQLWRGWDTSPGSLGEFCRMYLFATDYAMGKVDDSGDITLIAATLCDPGYTAGVSNRLIAVDTNPAHAVAGAAKVKWVSERLDEKLPAAPGVGADPVPTYVLDTGESGLTSFATPTLARLTAGGAVKVLTRYLIGNNMFPFDKDGDGSRESHAGCAAATGKVADEGTACTVTFIVDAATGVKEAALTAPNPNSWYETATRYPFRQNPPVVADLDGDGQVEIISGGDVFRYASGQWTLAWQATPAPGTTYWYEAVSVSVADMDGDGKAEVILQAEWDDNVGHQRGFLVYDANGRLLHAFSYPAWDGGAPTLADVDGDGVPEIVFVARGIVYAYHADGTLVWAGVIPDDDGTLPGDPPGLRYSPNAVGDRSGAGSHVQVYDLDLDGSPEVIVNATYRVAIFNGRTGMVKTSTHNNALARTNTFPMIVDADGDGHAEILSAAGNPGICSGCASGNIIPFAGENRDWAPAPLVFNQASYNPWASDDTAAIKYDGGVHRSFRNQRQMGEVTDPRTRDTTKFTYAATDSTGTSLPATVTITVAPTNRAPVITSTPPTAIAALPAPGSCTTGCVYSNVIYQLAAYDPDTGDMVHYEMPLPNTPLSFPYGSIDPTTGLVTMFVGPCGGSGCDFGPTLFVVAAVDSFGARTEQSFIVDISTQLRTVPNVIGLEEDDATAAIVAAGLRAHVTEVYAANPPGIVVAQNPSAGAPNVTRTATVDISVSKGPAPVKMPFVVGQQIVAASALLGSLGIDFAVDPIASGTVPAGQVTTQDPAFGTMVAPGVDGPAALGVSMGPPLVKPITSIVVEPGESSRLVNDQLAFKATAVFNDGTSADITLRAAWSSSLPVVASVDVTGVAKGLLAGDTIVSAALSGKSAGSALHIKPRFTEGSLPVAAIAAPADDATVYGPVDVTGTASDANFLRYELAIARAGDDHYTLLAEGSAPIVGGVLGKLDPTALVNDLYTLRLSVFDRADNVSVATSSVQVAGERKVGLFSLTFEDLRMPAAGVPLAVDRTYDSRDKTQGDFGIGWRLGLRTLRLRANRVPGEGWVRTVSGPTVSLAATSAHYVSVALPSGKLEEFDMRVSPTSNIGSLDATRATGYAARPGTQGTLQALVNVDLLIVNDGASDVLVDDGTFDTFEPHLYLYTAVDGTRFEISPDDGVRKVTDTNGNAVTFGPQGILHSDGKGIVFTRDTQDRIVAVADPLGNVQTYAYDGNGDLAAHTDPLGHVTRFAYNRTHGLIEIVDPAGHRIARNEYDDAGRLVAMIDADGKRIEIAHDANAQQEIVTDRRGNVDQISYDAQGNVIASVKSVTIEGVPVAVTTLATYDALGNETSRTDADGRRIATSFDAELPLTQVVDPAGIALTTTFAYTPSRDVDGVTDAFGRTYGFTWDSARNLVGTDTPANGSTTAIRDAQGRPTQSVDAGGTTTTLTYDADGNVTREEARDATNVLLRRADYAFDANGNRTAETVYRTVDGVLTPFTTRFAYDARNRLVATTDAAGGITRVEFDDAGRVLANVDALGHRVDYTYDGLGRLLRTRYADGSEESLAYDANNNVVASTDRGGHTTTMAYDELDRNISTTLADGSTTRTVYSPAGKVVATIDAAGNRTDYEFDAAGRGVATTYPEVPSGIAGTLLRPRVTYAPNALGAVSQVVDPEGRATSFEYDAKGRLARTTYADGSSVQQTFDALGRRTSVINEEGQATLFSYDGLGRVAGVSGLSGNAAYAYDEAGNLLSMTDALGRVTRLRYDALNRPIERRYPGGEIERIAYDAAGNVIAATDANGKTTTFEYDAMDRLLRANMPGGGSERYTYNADGQRSSVVDSRGTAAYGYDAVGRLASLSSPDGTTVSYASDAKGNLASITSAGGTLAYTYDAMNRLAKMASPEGDSRYAYDRAGNRVRSTRPNSVISDYTFDARNRPSQLVHRLGATTLQSFATLYSPAGHRTKTTEADGSIEQYGYDAQGRLVSETRSGNGAYALSHVYDAVGNRTQEVRDGITTSDTYDNDDRLLSHGSVTYGYDANGNRISRNDGATLTQYGYDARNRLATVQGGGASVQYTYDTDGNRVATSTPGQSTRFVVAARNNTGFAQVLEERDGGGNLAARYSWSNELVAMARDGAVRYFQRDAQGSTRTLSSAVGSITDQYRSDAYGRTLLATGGTLNPYRHDGERLDDETGLYQLRARYYDPETGRFMSRDPSGGRAQAPKSLHRYLFADADPANHADPSGRESLASLVVAQGISDTLDVAMNLGPYVTYACNLKERLDVVGKIILWGGLSASAIAVFTNAVPEWSPVKTAFSIVGVNPIALGSDLSSVEVRLEVPWNLALNLTQGNKVSKKLSIGPKGLFASSTVPLWSDNIYKCGVPVGEVSLQAGVKSGGNTFKGTGSITGQLAARLAIAKVFRMDFPLLELGIQFKPDGSPPWVDKAFGIDLFGGSHAGGGGAGMY